MADAQRYTVFMPDVWSPRVTEFFRRRLVLGRVLTDESAAISDGGDQIVIPNLANNFNTVSNIVTTTGAITGIAINDTSTRIDINKWVGKALNFTDYQMALIAKQYRLRQRYAQGLGYAVARNFDNQLSTDLKQGLTNSLGTSTDSLVSTTLEHAFAILESNSVPRDELALVVHPNVYYGDLHNIQKYYDASQFGAGAPTRSGSIDMLYGVPVFRTSNLGDTASSQTTSALANYLIHPEAAAYAFGTLPNSGGQRIRISEERGENLRTKVVASGVYGTKILRSGAGVLLKAAK